MKRLFFTSAMVLAIFFSGCKSKVESCGSNEVLDKRMGGALASLTVGLCIPNTAAILGPEIAALPEWTKGTECKGTLISKDVPNATTGIKAATPVCLSGCPKDNLDAVDGSCRSLTQIGSPCGTIADCADKNAICLSDPLVSGTIVEQFNTLAKVDASLQAMLKALSYEQVTPGLVRDLVGLNYCTIKDCNLEGNQCPEGNECVDATEAPPMSKKSGFMVCKPIVVADTDITPDTNTGEEPDTATVSDETDNAAAEDTTEVPDEDTGGTIGTACYGNPCAAHAECKVEGCDATFCTTLLGSLVANNPNVCILRCDPANANADCPEGQVCDGQVALAGSMGIDIDNAKGVCKTSTMKLFRGSNK